MTEKKAPALHESTLALSEKLQKGITVNAKTGVATAVETLYKDNLPSDVTMDHVKSISDYNTTFIAASTHAFGLASVDAAKGNKKLEKISIDIPMGVKDDLTLTFDRVKTIPNRFGNGEDITKYGEISKPIYTTRAGKNGAQLKAARAAINELAMAALAKG